MTQRRVRFDAITTTSTFLLSLLCSLFTPTISTVDFTSIIANNHRQSLLLPLSPSKKIPSTEFRRHLQAKRIPPTARMNLFDDLLSNGYAYFFDFVSIFWILFYIINELRFKFFVFRYYTTRLYIGTPSQEFALIVDTGSTVTYVPCSDCDQCGNHQVFFLQFFYILDYLLKMFVTSW